MAYDALTIGPVTLRETDMPRNLRDTFGPDARSAVLAT